MTALMSEVMTAPPDPVQCYSTLGTTLLADVYDPRLVADLQFVTAELLAVHEGSGGPGGTWNHAPQVVRDVIQHDAVVTLMCQVLEVERVRTASWQLLPWRAGESTQWHRDHAHVPLTGDRVGVWLPVLARPEGTGLHYQPFHDDSGRTVTWSIQPGDVSFHSPHINHTSRPSSVPTLGLASYFFPDGERLQYEPSDGSAQSAARRMLARTIFAGLDDGDVISGDGFPVLP